MKLKTIHSIFKYIFIVFVIISSILLGYTLIGGLLSYHIGFNAIVDYHQAFGTDKDVMPIFDLSRIYKELIFIIMLFLSIFFINKKWFFKYTFTLLIIKILVDLFFNKEGMMDLIYGIILNIPLIYIIIFYLIDKKFHKEKI